MAEGQDPNASPNEGGNNNMNGGDAGSAWHESLPEDVREHAQGFESAEAMVREFAGMKGKIPVVPEAAEGYTYDIPKDHPMPLNDAELKAVRNFAKGAGLTNDQFAKVIDAQLQLRSNFAKGKDAEIKKAQDELKTEWGASYETNLGAADATINKLFDEGFNKFARESGIASNPAFVRGMHKLSQVVSEDSFDRGGTTGKGGSSHRDPVTGLPMLKYPSMEK